MNKKVLLSLLFALSCALGMAQSKDEKAVLDQVETWRKAVLNQDVAILNTILAKEMTYGHSNGHMDTKDTFISTIGDRKEVYNQLELADFTVSIVGDIALVRHFMVADIAIADGSAMKPNLGVLQVWTRTKKGWQLLARQAYKR